MTTWEVWTRLWSWNAPAWVFVLGMTALYAWLYRQDRAAAPSTDAGDSAGNASAGQPPSSKRRIGWAAAGLLLFIVAMMSPLEALANEYLFSAHMAQHILLLLVVPPLLVLGLPVAPMRRILSRPFPSWVDKHVLRAPLTWFLGLGTMYLWHVPSLCTLSVRATPIHVLQYASLLLAGALFIWPVAHPLPERRQSLAGSLLYLGTACTACGVLGVYIAFSPRAVCPCYLNPPDTLGIQRLVWVDWGLAPRADQELAGLMKWVPACFVYLIAMMVVLGRWMASADLRTRAAAPRRGRARAASGASRNAAADADAASSKEPCHAAE